MALRAPRNLVARSGVRKKREQQLDSSVWKAPCRPLKVFVRLSASMFCFLPAACRLACCLSVCLCLLVCLSVCLPHLSLRLSLCLSVRPSVCLSSRRLFVCLPACPSVRLSVCLSVCLSFCLPWRLSCPCLCLLFLCRSCVSICCAASAYALFFSCV